MNILFAATELYPWVKVGGLADVAAALPKALLTLQHRVTVALPRYAAFERSGLLLGRRLTPLTYKYGGESREAILYDTRLPSQVDLCLIDCFDGRALPSGSSEELRDDAVYGGSDEERAERFGMFAAAVAALAESYEVLHASDWPTAAALYHAKVAGLSARRVLTIHNAAHQGVFERTLAPKLGLTDAALTVETGEFYEKLNLLKLGITSAEVVTTVSPSYARSLSEEPHAAGLSGVYRALPSPVAGILNGIDTSVWNPAIDPHLVARYDAESVSATTNGKARCRGALQRELGLEPNIEVPIVAFVGRLTAQKGVDALLAALPGVLRATDAQFVAAGAGDAETAAGLRELASVFPGRVAFVESAPESVVHRMFAGASAVIVPSRFEPCGLVQMYAQRYGAIPVVHATGGLSDSVVDCDSALETGTGILFDDVSGPVIEAAILRALAALSHPRADQLVRRVMRLERGWDRPARQYERLYRR
jgi:starch synthase